ncbi:MAG: hypothetical protein D6781_06850 [Verrucomicrobia bacterium]|nr:MAG: hypothetical protein D6781_06850 [Verrucomicrobiota bacterium]
MPADGHPQSDPELNRLLRAWHVDASPDPTLAARVQARLHRENDLALSGWLSVLARHLTRPLAAAALIGTFAFAGALAARLQIERRHDEQLARLAAEYVRTIDPIRMVASEADAPSRP